MASHQGPQPSKGTDLGLLENRMVLVDVSFTGHDDVRGVHEPKPESRKQALSHLSRNLLAGLASCLKINDQ